MIVEQVSNLLYRRKRSSSAPLFILWAGRQVTKGDQGSCATAETICEICENLWIKIPEWSTFCVPI